MACREVWNQQRSIRGVLRACLFSRVSFSLLPSSPGSRTMLLLLVRVSLESGSIDLSFRAWVSWAFVLVKSIGASSGFFPSLSDLLSWLPFKPNPFIMASKSISLVVDLVALLLFCSTSLGARESPPSPMRSLLVLRLSFAALLLDRFDRSFLGACCAAFVTASSSSGSLGTSFSHHSHGFLVMASGYLSAFAYPIGNGQGLAMGSASVADGWASAFKSVAWLTAPSPELLLGIEELGGLDFELEVRPPRSRPPSELELLLELEGLLDELEDDFERLLELDGLTSSAAASGSGGGLCDMTW